jgi:hypothetical protein
VYSWLSLAFERPPPDDESCSSTVMFCIYLIVSMVSLLPQESSDCHHTDTMAPLLSPRKRGKLVAHVLDGKTYKEIAQRYQVAKGTIAYTMKRERLHNTQKSLPTGRRPHKLSERSLRWLSREIGLFPQSPWDYFAKALSVSESTIRREAAKMGLHKRICRKKPFLSEKSKAARRAWAATNVDQDWRRVIFTDECSVQIGEDITRHYTIRQAGEEYEAKHIRPIFRSGRTSLMVWGAIAYGKKWPLIRLPLSPQEVAIDGLGKGKGLNSARYIKYVLDGPLKRCVQAHRRARWRDVIVLEDNAPCHSSKATDAARQNLGITSLKHPSNSPDLNAIENLWDQVKLKLGRMNRRATSLDELWEQIQQAWDEIDIGSVNRVVDSMEERRRDVVAAKGSYTRF